MILRVHRKEFTEGIEMDRRNVLLILALIFIVAWMIPLFFPAGSQLRYAFEELRVLITGIYIGFFILKS